MKVTRRQLRQIIKEAIQKLDEVPKWRQMDAARRGVPHPGSHPGPKRETGTGLDLNKIKNTVIEGIDMTDHPDFSNAFVASAEYENAPGEFRDLTDDEIDYLNENEDEWVWEQVWEQVN